jgi:hypothetical protein
VNNAVQCGTPRSLFATAVLASCSALTCANGTRHPVGNAAIERAATRDGSVQSLQASHEPDGSSPLDAAREQPSDDTASTGSNADASIVAPAVVEDGSARPTGTQPAPVGTDLNTDDVLTTNTSTSKPDAATYACALEPSVHMSPVIATVGILTLSTNLTRINSGYVEFGRSGSYDLRAPIDTSAEEFRTVMLGMTPNTMFHYRVVVYTDDATCVSADHSLVTPPAPANAPVPRVETLRASQVSPGFVVTSTFANATGYMVIYNHTGELVWWYQAGIGPVARSRLSWDGKYIYGRNANPAGAPGGELIRVSLDGTRVERIRVDTGHHDMTPTPNNGLLLLTGGGRDDCGTITFMSPGGKLSQFYDLRDAFGAFFRPGADPCHCNSIDYNVADQSVSVSCLGQNAYVKLTQDAKLMWVLGGNNGQSDFSGDVHWSRQHGHHFVTPDRLLFYNNNGGGDSAETSSLAVELQLDLEHRTATRVWQYVGDTTSATFGDVQRLPNGNTLITYSNAALIREVDAKQAVVQNWRFDAGLGYAEHHTYLYK